VDEALVSSVHDLNNLLLAIRGHCELLLGKLGEDEPARRHAEEIAKTAESATALTSRLLSASRAQD
jgi:two-component system cell cycle sensor histidine kinase/response regulator CckA